MAKYNQQQRMAKHGIMAETMAAQHHQWRRGINMLSWRRAAS